MPTTLVLSPHLDDAVLSIGGSLAAWVRAGDRVVVASVYTAGPSPDEVEPSMRAFADYAVRLAEDRAAMAIVGAESRWLGQIERAFRPPFLSNFDFFSTTSRAGFPTLASVTDAIAALAESLDRIDRIVVPIGAGNHVDHVETLLAATDWALAAGLAGRLVFYEDFYAAAPALRAAHAVLAAHPLHRDPLARAPRLAAVMARIGRVRSGPDPITLLAQPLREARWRLRPIDVRATERVKLAAIACYRSQTGVFGGLLGIARTVLAYHAAFGGAEPSWIPDAGA